MTCVKARRVIAERLKGETSKEVVVEISLEDDGMVTFDLPNDGLIEIKDTDLLMLFAQDKKR